MVEAISWAGANNKHDIGWLWLAFAWNSQVCLIGSDVKRWGLIGHWELQCCHLFFSRGMLRECEKAYPAAAHATPAMRINRAIQRVSRRSVLIWACIACILYIEKHVLAGLVQYAAGSYVSLVRYWNSQDAWCYYKHHVVLVYYLDNPGQIRW